MADPPKILEGVFAINKPPKLSSAQVIRELQQIFAKSKTFAPLLTETRRKQEEQDHHQPKRRRHRDDGLNLIKMGHGGTLDPLATGVLIIGVGRGTKHLHSFLGCTKTYETVVLFGKSTDTYDVAGKIVASAPCEHVAKELVESKLSKFRGNIKQVPPIYSALKIQGMKAYEYARSGKELPRELESREMNVDECTMLEWYRPSEHEYRWPAEEASKEDKDVAQKLLQSSVTTKSPIDNKNGGLSGQEGTSRAQIDTEKSPKPSEDILSTEATIDAINKLSPTAKAALHTHHLPEQSSEAANAPAMRVRLTVSSGFYVRSFAHDLGIECGSLGIMAELIRSRQGDYTCLEAQGDSLIPCLTYEDLDRGEDIWGPKISTVLEKWMVTHPNTNGQPRADGRNLSARSSNFGRGQERFQGDRSSGFKRSWKDANPDHSRRRNSSSPEI